MIPTKEQEEAFNFLKSKGIVMDDAVLGESKFPLRLTRDTHIQSTINIVDAIVEYAKMRALR